MIVTYKRLWDPVNQFQTKNGAINVAGRVFVRLESTDDLAKVYDENGSLIAQPIILDNNGRARGVFVDPAKTYWIDVQDRYGMSLFTIRKMSPTGSSSGIDIDVAIPFFKGKGVDDLWYNYEGGQVDMNAFDIVTMSTAFPDGTFGNVPACNAPDTFKVEIISGQPRLMLYKPGVYVVRALIHLKWAGTPVAEFATVDGRPFDLSYQHTDAHEKQANIINNGRETPISCTLILPASSFADVPEYGFSVRCASITIERLGDYVEPVVGE